MPGKMKLKGLTPISASAKIREKLIKDEKITKELIDTYISLYPTKVYKNLYDTGVVYAITQG